ncbi:hypothetical protein TcG_10281 [Trypanosoma cruzi]|nr:hypothetical protein TcG_10281 [Trypanosoma cruzi]
MPNDARVLTRRRSPVKMGWGIVAAAAPPAIKRSWWDSVVAPSSDPCVGASGGPLLEEGTPRCPGKSPHPKLQAALPRHRCVPFVPGVVSKWRSRPASADSRRARRPSANAVLDARAEKRLFASSV